jgi:hypothetical protein
MPPEVELHVGNQIVAATLTPIGDRWRGRERPHPLAQAFGNGRETGLTETIDLVNHERRKARARERLAL